MDAKPGIQIPGTDLWVRRNERGRNEYYISKDHVDIDTLRQIISNISAEYLWAIPYHMADDDLEKLKKYIVLNVPALNDRNKYWNVVPHYPRPVEFHLSRIAHVTTEEGLHGILACSGFRGGQRGNLLWWGFQIGPNEIFDAEQGYLEKHFPEQQRQQERFLPQFTTSPAFMDGSRYGNFRFSFPLAEVLHEYRTQFCGDKDPVLRVHETVMYKQEVMYVVLIHSPDVHDYDDYPVLGDNDDGVCAYRGGQIIWRAQAISETHRSRLTVNRQENQVQVEEVGESVFYVWDHVTLAFHLPPGRILLCRDLLNCLSACDNGGVPLNTLIGKAEAERTIQTYMYYQRTCMHVSPLGPQPSPNYQWGQPPNHRAYNPSYIPHGGYIPPLPPAHVATNLPRPSNPGYSNSYRGGRRGRGGRISNHFHDRQPRLQNQGGSNPQIQGAHGGYDPRIFYNRQPRLQNQGGSNPQIQGAHWGYEPRMLYYNQPCHWNTHQMQAEEQGPTNTYNPQYSCQNP